MRCAPPIVTSLEFLTKPTLATYSYPMFIHRICRASLLVALFGGIPSVQSTENAAGSTIRHSYLVMGGRTAIIGEDGKPVWEYRGGSRDGFILPNGNALIA